MASRERPSYWLARTMFLRGLGFIYAVGFLVAINQWRPLLGQAGLLPTPFFFEQVRAAMGWRAFVELPTLFWLHPGDAFPMFCGWVGLLGSLFVVAGVANAALMALLWLLYTSFVHAGQLFYGYGWEMMMVEAGFLAVFLCPLRRWRPMPEDAPPPEPVIWMLRWMLFRVMFGAGLIKLRGDACWWNLTCLDYHFETQPIPNPLSWYFHNLPELALKLGVVFNHIAEVMAPWLVFAPGRFRMAGGLIIVAFQLVLILSGNLSFLNYLTIVIAFACFDDRFWSSVLRWRGPLPTTCFDMRRLTPRSAALWALCVLIGVLSIQPAVNLFSSHQVMNGSFEPIGLVNTYGAFGSVGQERLQLVLEGTRDDPPTDKAAWREYPFKCSPGDPRRRPCVVSPYQERLDWQIWFAGMEEPRQNVWLFHLVLKLLQNDRGALGLLGGNPFPDRPPKSIRAVLYRYRFTRPADHSRDWWKRERVGVYLPPLSLDNPYLQPLLRSSGLIR